MLQRDENGGPEPNLSVYGFLVGVQLVEGLKPEEVAMKLADALNFVEGIGDITVDILGQVDVVEEDPAQVEITEWGPMITGGSDDPEC